MRKGFTLIELSIVLIIVGVLIGGILVGRSMIETTKITSLMREMNQIQIAGENFYTKYNMLPGDCSRCAALGLGNSGNGDGRINMSLGGALGEGTLFFLHLENAGLIAPPKSGHYTATSSDLSKEGDVNAYRLKSYNDPKSHIYLEHVLQNYPAQPVFFMLESTNGNAFSVGYDSVNWNAAFLTANQALAFDSKFDDGEPITGLITGAAAYKKDTNTWAGCSAPGWPFTMPAKDNYYLQSDSYYCILQMRVFTNL